MTLDDDPSNARTLTKVPAELARPIFENRGFSPSGTTVVVGQPHQDVTADRLSHAGPLVLPAQRQSAMEQLNAGYRGIVQRQNR